MNQKQNLRVVLQLKTPLHISDPTPAAVTTDGKFAAEGFPCTRTTHAPRVVDGEIKYLPCIPANTIRHQLRAQLLEQIFAELENRSQPISLNAYAAISCGAATGAPDGVQATYQERRDIAAHPFLGLFGGGPRMLTGKLSAGDALAITPHTMGLAPGYEHLAVNGKITAIQWMVRKNPLPNAPHQAVSGGAQAISETEATLLAGKERGLAAMNCRQYVIPGVSMALNISLNNPTQAQLGAIITAVFALSTQPIGGKASHGYGQTELISVTLNGAEIAVNGEADMDNAEVNDAITAWHDALSMLNASELEAFAASQKAEPKPKKSKAEKAEKA